MRQRVVTCLIALVAVASVVLPVVLSIRLGRDASRDEAVWAAQSAARQLLERSDASALEIDEAIQRLKAIADGDACSPVRLAAMREIAVSQSYLRVVGAVNGDAIVCSSLGRGEAIPIGSVNFVSARGFRFRLNVRLPIARDRQFLVVERDGFAAVLRNDAIVDLPDQENEVSMAVYSHANGTVLSSRGYVDDDWLRAAPAHENSVAFHNGYAVAFAQSSRFDVGAAVAVPLNTATRWTTGAGVLLVPVALLAGLGVAGSAAYFYRLRAVPGSSMRGALRRGEFFMVYQPVIELETGRWVGAEALIRWRRSSGEIVRPDLFIPMAEASGFIVEITARVMDLVGDAAAGIFREFPNFHLALNLSAADLFDLETPGRLRQLSARTDAGPGNLIAEVTERSFVEAPRARSVLAELHRSHVATAIDDFGTGYSSLSHLEELHLDYLKIDKAFVDSLATGAVTRHVIDHIIEMAKSLDLRMIAEGVESEAQAAELRARGVQFAQGWLFAKPMAFSELVGRLRSQEST